jgi:hypothetical protein
MATREYIDNVIQIYGSLKDNGSTSWSTEIRLLVIHFKKEFYIQMIWMTIQSVVLHFGPVKLDPATFIEIIGIGIECFLVMEWKT